jgi:hypothetical protein
MGMGVAASILWFASVDCSRLLLSRVSHVPMEPDYLLLAMDWEDGEPFLDEEVDAGEGNVTYVSNDLTRPGRNLLTACSF